MYKWESTRVEAPAQQARRGGKRARREKNRKGQFSLHVSPPLHWGDFLAAKNLISNFQQRSMQSTPMSFHYRGLSLMRMTHCVLTQQLCWTYAKAPNHTHSLSLSLSLSLKHTRIHISTGQDIVEILNLFQQKRCLGRKHNGICNQYNVKMLLIIWQVSEMLTRCNVVYIMWVHQYIESSI